MGLGGGGGVNSISVGNGVNGVVDFDESNRRR